MVMECIQVKYSLNLIDLSIRMAALRPDSLCSLNEECTRVVPELHRQNTNLKFN